MQLDNNIINRALSNLAHKYLKILYVNLESREFKIGEIPDNEYEQAKLYKNIDDYLKWFHESGNVHPDDVRYFQQFTENIEAGNSFVYRRKSGTDENGNDVYKYVMLAIYPMPSENEENTCCALYVKDVHETYSKQYDLIVDEIGTKDPLTGMYNRLAFDRDFTAAKGDIGILYADVNGLKWVNDHQGHKAGDDIIIKVANLLQINFDNIKVYHISGDEFIILSTNNARNFIKQCLMIHKSMWCGAGDYPMASIGYSVGKDFEKDDILEDAEKAMLDDKSVFYQHHPRFIRK